MAILLKRAYEPFSPKDGFRILVDRLWPRGIAKDTAHIDLWLKEIAPSTALRQWFGHEPAKWEEFQRRYRDELQHNPEAIARIMEHVRDGIVTLLYSAKDEKHNQAVVLKEYLETLGKRPPTSSRHGA